MNPPYCVPRWTRNKNPVLEIDGRLRFDYNVSPKETCPDIVGVVINHDAGLSEEKSISDKDVPCFLIYPAVFTKRHKS